VWLALVRRWVPVFFSACRRPTNAIVETISTQYQARAVSGREIAHAANMRPAATGVK
jgi:hypothetical protein